MKPQLFFIFFYIKFCIFVVNSLEDSTFMSYDFLYKEGVTAYLDENWSKCVKCFELALKDWHFWKENIIGCRKKCHEDSRIQKSILDNPTDVEKYYESIIYNTLCLIKCKKSIFGSRMDRVASEEIEKNFDSRKPYDYLQLCYYMEGRYLDAANAAVTVIAAQPEHSIMITNLQYYISDYGVDVNDVTNLELEEFAKEYILGNNAYMDEDYKKCIEHLEKSFKLYIKAENDCRLLCEAPFDQGWFPDFVLSVAIGNLKKACESVESFLHLNPDDLEQIRNKQFYYAQPKVSEEDFTPRNDVVELKRIWDNDLALLKYIETNFIFFDDDGILEDVPDEENPGTDSVEERFFFKIPNFSSDNMFVKNNFGSRDEL